MVHRRTEHYIILYCIIFLLPIVIKTQYEKTKTKNKTETGDTHTRYSYTEIVTLFRHSNCFFVVLTLFPLTSSFFAFNTPSFGSNLFDFPFENVTTLSIKE